jgi:hypothetical protein
MVGPKKQDFCPRINMLKGNFDTNYFELLMNLSSWSKGGFMSEDTRGFLHCQNKYSKSLS